MLLTTMTPAEITSQIQREYQKLWNTTVNRLLQEYDRERKKFKIDKGKTYPKDYHVKTGGKNNWVICICKAAGQLKYNGQFTSSVSCAVYYYYEKGIRVLIPADDGRATVLNAHFFKRYNERLNLQLNRTLDVITHFLKNNIDIYDALVPQKNKVRVIGYCRQGVLLGEMMQENNWLVWKTFVNRELIRDDQQNTENILITQQYMAAMAELEKDDFDENLVINILGKLTAVNAAKLTC